MKVVYAVPTVLSHTGGHIQHVLGICRHAHKSGIEVELYCVKSNHSFKDLPFKIKMFEVESADPKKMLHQFSNRLVKELSNGPKPDWVYFRPYPLDYIFFSRHLVKMKIPYAYELNTLWADELKSQCKHLKSFIYPFFEAKSIQNASALFPVTQEIATHAKKVGGKDVPCLVAGNGIEIPKLPNESVSELRTCWKLPQDKKLVVMAGFTRAWHGHEKLLLALKLLPEDIHVVLVGSENSSVTEQTMKTAKESGVVERVHILPWLSHLEVDQVVYACDVGVSPLGLEKKKMKEAQSLKVRHYLAMGIPVLIAGGESADVLNSQFTFQIKDTSPDEISKGLIELLAYNNNRDEMRTFASSKLSWEAISSKTFEFLKQL